MKTSRYVFAAIVAVAGASFAIGSLAHSPNDGDQPKKKDKIAAALDSLEAQLQRRFHDRQNIQFGYSRVIRPGARIHGDVTSGIGRSFVKRDDGKPVANRKAGDEFEYEVEDGVWVKPSQFREMLHPENDAERKLKADLKDVDVALYTAGLFDAESGTPYRIKGPAYLRYGSAEAPVGEKIGATIAKAWKTQDDADELRFEGWVYRVVKVKADDKSCLDCHNGMTRYNDKLIKSYELNQPIGTFVIATKIK